MTIGSSNPTSQPSADGWKPVPLRDEIAPRFFTQDSNGALCLGLAGAGLQAADGCWQKRFPAVEGKYYAFAARCRTADIAQPLRSVLVRLIWLDADGNKLNRGEYPSPAGPADADGWTTLRGTYLAPPKTAALRADLCLRWSADGQVLWRDIEVTQSGPAEPRLVRLGTVSRRPADSKGPRQNLELFALDIAELALRGADIICLPEGCTVVGTGKKYPDVAEGIPGPSTQFLGELAARHKVYIAAGIYERDGAAFHNTAVLLGRDGKLVGKFRKVCLPDEEAAGGLCPGNDYPVFQTDFGCVGVMICWDLSYPEVARRLAAAGAEVILMPIWGGKETLARARAIENQIYLVASGYDFRSAIYDPFGNVLAAAAKDPKEASENLLVQVDLAAAAIWPWIGNWKARIFREEPAPPQS